MRLAISIIIGVFTLSTAAFAKAPQEFDGGLISYQQFMRLTVDKRKAYLQELREVLVMLEANQTRYEVASYNGEGGMSELKEQIASFLKMAEFLPSAAAEPALPIGVAPTLNANVPLWNSTARAWVCNVPEHVFDPELGTCVRTYTGVTGQTGVINFTENCPVDTITVPNVGMPTHRCVPRDSYRALSRARRKEIESGVRLSPAIFDSEDATFGRQYTHGANLYDNDGQRITSSGPSTEVTQGARPTEPPAARPDISGAVVPPVARPDLSASAPRPTAPVAAPNTCRFQELSCQNLNASQRQSLIQRFRSDRNANICIAGGYFTRKNPTPQRGKGSCELVKEMRQTAPSAANPNGIVKKCDKNAAGKEQAMCNPTVFCVGLKINQKVRDQMKKEGHANRVRAAIARKAQELRRQPNAQETAQITAAVPQITDAELDRTLKSIDGTDDKVQTLTYCADVSQDMTASCSAKLQEHIDGKAGATGYIGAGYQYEQCDPAKLKGFPLQDEWNRLAANTLAQYKAQCQGNSNANFKALFCKECNEIGQKIFAMNQRAVGVGCTEAAAPTAGARPPGETGAVPERISDEEERP